VRAVVEAAGIKDILSKSLGSSNPVNVVQAALMALTNLRDPQQVVQLRRRVAPPAPAPRPAATAEPASLEASAPEVGEPTVASAVPAEPPPAPATPMATANAGLAGEVASAPEPNPTETPSDG
jgi:hypothetical protein